MRKSGLKEEKDVWIWRRLMTGSPRRFLCGRLQEYGIPGPSWPIRSRYEHKESCVHILSINLSVFLVVGGCSLASILFLVFMDWISRRSQGQECVQDYISALCRWQVLLASLASDLQHALGRFTAECEAARIRISTSKSEAMVLCQKKVDCLLWVERCRLGRKTYNNNDNNDNDNNDNSLNLWEGKRSTVGQHS